MSRILPTRGPFPENERLARISRRRVLGTALAVGATLLAGPTYAFAATRRATRSQAGPTPGTDAAPATMAATGRAAGGAQSAGFPIGYLGLAWSGRDAGGAVRFRGPGGWGEWRPVHSDEAPAENRRSALIPAGGAVEYELSPARSTADLRVLAINTTDGPPTRSVLAPEAAEVPMPDASARIGQAYRRRAAWGADESLRFGPDGQELFPTAFFDVQTLTVHHTATANDDPDPAATVRAIYFFHTVTQDFGDIGYHLLVDRAGVVYEGRWSGPDPTPVFGLRSGGPLPRMSNGAHVGGFNAGNVGVALLGDLTTGQPTPAARESLTRVLAALARTTRLDPLGTTGYVNPISGATRTVATIAGHRDWLSTACPGDAFYPTLPDLRADVAAGLGDRR